jgi:hypothetical protein
MERALEIRCHRAIDRTTVEATPLTAVNAIDANERRRAQSWDERLQRINGDRPNLWWHIGWVSIQLNWLTNTWAMWLNIVDGRMHPRLECRRRSKRRRTARIRNPYDAPQRSSTGTQ